MGTQMHYALNLFSALSKNHGDTVNIETADICACSGKRYLKDNLKIGFDQIQDSMDRMLELYNQETVKKMMLKQEEIFKEQVRELHRLYRVQKKLMDELRNEQKLTSPANAVPGEIRSRSDYLDMDTRTAFWNTSTGSPTSYSPFSNSYHNANQMNSSYGFRQLFTSRASTSSQELTSCSRDTFRLHGEFDLEQPAEEDTSTHINVSNDQDQISHRFTKNKMTINDPQCLHYCDDAESDIELTLSIGYKTDKKKQKHRSRTKLEIGCSESNPDETRQLIPSTTVVSDQDEECSDTIASAAFEQERIQRPQWLFQSLSLNKT